MERDTGDEADEFSFLAGGSIEEPEEVAGVGERELTVHPTTERQMRENLSALGGEPEVYEEEESNLPWWDAGIESTLTIVLGAKPHAVAQVLGLVVEELSPQMVLDVAWAQESASPLSIVELEGATAVLEVNGFHTMQPHVAESLSTLGTTVCLYWNVNHMARFLVAEGGQLVRDFDPVIDEGGGVGDPCPEEEGIDWEESPIPKAAELQARLTGIRLTRGDLFGKPLLTVMMPW